MTANRIGDRQRRGVAALGAVIAIVVPTGTASAHGGPVLSGFGTPTIDGVISPG